MLVYDWKALDCTPTGFETLRRTHRLYATLRKDTLDALSYGSLNRHREVTLWVFTVHAINTRSFLSHLWHNVAAAVKRRCNAVMGTYDVKFEKAFQEVDWGSPESWGTRLVLLERALH